MERGINFCWSRNVVVAVFCLMLVPIINAGPAILPEDAAVSRNAVGEDSKCMTKECVVEAASIIKRMNSSVDPCEDFFDFACGNFVENTHIPDERSSVTMFSEISDELQKKLRIIVEAEITEKDSKSTKMAKSLYKSCMDIEKLEKEGLSPLTQLHKEMGGWPVVEGETWDDKNFSWIETNFRNRRLGFSVDYLFDFSVSTDVKNSTWRMIWLDQPSMGMSREYLMKGLNDSDVQAYLKYSIDIAMLFNATEELAKKEMLEVLNFQIQLANISLPREQRRNMTKLYNTMTLDELQKKVPEISWVEYTNSVLNNSIKVDGSERVGVSDITYFNNMQKILKKTPKRVLANYMVWRATSAAASYLSQNIRDIQFEYTKKLTGRTMRQQRWKECVDLVSGRLSYAMSNLYVKNYFNDVAKEQAEELVQSILSQFKVILTEIDWMDNSTKVEAMEKANTIRPQIGYPPELLIDENLNEHYKNLSVEKGTLLNVIRDIGIFGSDYSFGRLRQKVDKLDWKRQASVAVVNAYYSSIENSIKFPAGILQGIFFEHDRPKYLNYGGIGYVIGHEITHGFDDQGRQFDKDGNLRNWWDKSTQERFLKKTKCIIEQYGNYTVPENNMSLNGINTQGENIADNGGIKEAYHAYQNYVIRNGHEHGLPGLDYTPNQLFWISAGQVWCSKYRPQALKIRILTGVHSPGRFRVIGPLGNSEEFSKDWNCPAASPMNSENKCSVW